MKRNRSRFLVYPPNYSGNGGYSECHSKRQMKRELDKLGSCAEAHRVRLIHNRDGSTSFWNFDTACPTWVKP
jgi:hypothetical protein